MKIYYKHKIVLAIGVIMLILLALYFYNNYSSGTFAHNEELVTYENPDSLYSKKLEAEYSQLTQEQLANRKRSAEDVLEKLLLQLESDSLNPEEAHEAMLTISNIKQELELIDKYLHN